MSFPEILKMDPQVVERGLASGLLPLRPEEEEEGEGGEEEEEAAAAALEREVKEEQEEAVLEEVEAQRRRRRRALAALQAEVCHGGGAGDYLRSGLYSSFSVAALQGQPELLRALREEQLLHQHHQQQHQQQLHPPHDAEARSVIRFGANGLKDRAPPTPPPRGPYSAAAGRQFVSSPPSSPHSPHPLRAPGPSWSPAEEEEEDLEEDLEEEDPVEEEEEEEEQCAQPLNLSSGHRKRASLLPDRRSSTSNRTPGGGRGGGGGGGGGAGATSAAAAAANGHSGRSRGDGLLPRSKKPKALEISGPSLLLAGSDLSSIALNSPALPSGSLTPAFFTAQVTPPANQHAARSQARRTALSETVSFCHGRTHGHTHTRTHTGQTHKHTHGQTTGVMSPEALDVCLSVPHQ